MVVSGFLSLGPFLFAQLSIGLETINTETKAPYTDSELAVRCGCVGGGDI